LYITENYHLAIKPLVIHVPLFMIIVSCGQVFLLVASNF